MLCKGFQRPKRLEFERETSTERFGRFYAQPFERGFGTTIGNTLRRVLLSSIEGAAITAVKIDGVQHEFSPIQGVVEDATDIILNLEASALHASHDDDEDARTCGWTRRAGAGEGHRSRLRHRDPRAGSLHRDGVGKRQAAHGAAPQARPWLRRRPTRTSTRTSASAGSPIDSVHSPVKKVNYLVEPRASARTPTTTS